MIKSKVLFLCTENLCRTQMAEALLRDPAGDRFDIVSAGADPDRVDPEPIREQERTYLIFPGAIWRQQWALETPALASDHSIAVRRVQDQLQQRVIHFAGEHQ
ncbi:MAG: hypothetical protein ABSE57_13905 [Bryobacteraceae bacterium]|jgi:ArsR family transcriptional regulator